VLTCGDNEKVYDLSEKPFYTVGGEGKDIILLGDQNLEAVIYHDLRGGTFIYDCGKSSTRFYQSKSKFFPPQTGYVLEVDKQYSFGDPKSSCSTRARVIDAAAPRALEQAKSKASVRTGLTNGAESTLKRPADKELGSAPSADHPGADAKNSLKSGADAAEADAELERVFRTFTNHLDPPREAVSSDPEASKVEAKATDKSVSEPPHKRQRSDAHISSQLPSTPAGKLSDTSAAATQPLATKMSVSEKPSLPNHRPTNGASNGYVSSLPRAKNGVSSDRAKEDTALQKRCSGGSEKPIENHRPATSSGPARPSSENRAASTGTVAARPSSENRTSQNGFTSARHGPVYGPAAPPQSQRYSHDRAPDRVRGRAESPQRSGQRQASVGASVNGSKPAAKNNGKCDKCDGPHPTDRCPHFKKGRDNHKDAWVNYGKEHPGRMGNDGGNYVLRDARVVRQPGDGSCLFHSLTYGLKAHGDNLSATALRHELANFIKKHPKLEIAGDTLEEWVNWDSNTSVNAYAQRMAAGRAWGGGIEIAACSLLRKANIHVYERKGNEIRRISCFDYPEKTRRLVHILYQGGMHYDALVPGR
jgi:hypothetical protein